MRKKIYGVLLLAIALAGVGYYFGTAATEVEVVTVGRGNIHHTVANTGTVQAAEKFELYASQGGRVISLPVNVGQTVEKDQVLMVLENKDLTMSSQQLQIQLNQAGAAVSAAQAALQQGQLDLAEVQAQFNRAQELYSAGAMSSVDYEAARSLLDKTRTGIAAQEQTLKAAQAQVSNYQSLVANSRLKEQELLIKSPISGTLMELPVQEERVVATGTLLAQVTLANDLEIKANLLADDMGEVQLGQKVQITAPVLGDQILSGEIIKIYPQAEEEQSALGVIQRRVPTLIKPDSTGNLKPGYETRVNIITASKNDIILVPREAVLTLANDQKQVMLIVGGRVKFQAVTTGLSDNKNIEISEGLQAGDQIVKDASVTLKANTKVKIKEV